MGNSGGGRYRVRNPTKGVGVLLFWEEEEEKGSIRAPRTPEGSTGLAAQHSVTQL